MGAALRATQRSLDRPVVLKLMATGAVVDPMLLARFESEARILARLDHPHVLPVVDFGCEEGVAYIAYPDLEGRALADRLAAGPAPTPPEAAAWLVQTLDGLEHIHAHGIVHRDLKPANLLLAGDGTIRIFDFGLARDLLGDQYLTATGTIVGTPLYLSPEQIRAEAPDPRDDLYAVGVLAYRLFTGVEPFAATSLDRILDLHLAHDPDPVHRCAPGVPVPVGLLVQDLMAKERARRPARARDARERLADAFAGPEPGTRVADPAREGRRGPATPLRSGPSVPPAARVRPATPVPGPSPRGPDRRAVALGLAAGMALGLGLGLAVGPADGLAPRPAPGVLPDGGVAATPLPPPDPEPRPSLPEVLALDGEDGVPASCRAVPTTVVGRLAAAVTASRRARRALEVAGSQLSALLADQGDGSVPPAAASAIKARLLELTILGEAPARGEPLALAMKSYRDSEAVRVSLEAWLRPASDALVEALVAAAASIRSEPPTAEAAAVLAAAWVDRMAPAALAPWARTGPATLFGGPLPGPAGALLEGVAGERSRRIRQLVPGGEPPPWTEIQARLLAAMAPPAPDPWARARFMTALDLLLDVARARREPVDMAGIVARREAALSGLDRESRSHSAARIVTALDVLGSSTDPALAALRRHVFEDQVPDLLDGVAADGRRLH